MTDPDRTPEPWTQAARLPAGAGVIFRGFGLTGAEAAGRRLAGVCRAQGLRFLVGADAELAEALDADGLHLPERSLRDGPRHRRRHPDWLMTGAAHSLEALELATYSALDAALISPVFDSTSSSAGEPLGVARFSDWVAGAGISVYALGGVTVETAPRLIDSGACGVAGVSFI